MKIRPNIGIINSLIRITIGFTVLSWSTAKLVKHPWRDSYIFMAMLAGMKIAEGILRFCPITELFERGQEKMQERHEHENNGAEVDEIKEAAKMMEQMLPYNPS